MFEKKCTLCGGDLDGRKICKECGLNNNKSEKYYKVNQSSCDGQPLTHIHEEKYQMPDEDNKEQQKADDGRSIQKHYSGHNSGYQMAGQNRKSRSAATIGKIIAIITVIMTIVGIVLTIVEDHGTEIVEWVNTEAEDSSNSDYKYDPYQYLENELAETGDFVEYELSSGKYIVGFHIPEGKYSAQTMSEFDSVKVDDYENGIYLYEYADEEENNLNDLRLFEGAVVTIKCEETVRLTSDNGQTAQMEEGADNPVTEAVEITGNKMVTAGDDFEAGIYDVALIEGEGYVDFTVSDENGEVMDSESVYLGGEYSNGTSFTYMMLPEKSIVTCSQEMRIKMTPSEKICNAF